MVVIYCPGLTTQRRRQRIRKKRRGIRMGQYERLKDGKRTVEGEKELGMGEKGKPLRKEESEVLEEVK